MKNVRREVLQNGAVVLTRETRVNDIVATIVMLRMGSGFESDIEAGLSTLLQDSLLKGTITRTASQIATDIETLGASLDSSAQREYGVVSLITTKDEFLKGLDILFDVLRSPVFPENEVEREKDLIIQQIAKRKDQLLYNSFDLFNESFYGEHPYHKPQLGYPETVKKFTRDDVLRFYKRFYMPDNMIFSIVGNFDAGAAVNRIKSTFGALPRGNLPVLDSVKLPERLVPLERFQQQESQATWIVVGYDAPSILEREFAAMEVFDAILGGSMDSRLFKELRDKRGLAYEVGCIYAARKGPSFLAAYMGTENQQFGIAKQGILEVISRLKEEGPSGDELVRAKKYIKGTFTIGQERNVSQAALIATYDLYGLGYEFVDRYPRLIDDVSLQDVKAVALKYLGNYVLAAVGENVDPASQGKNNR
jgi:predicted Zn-dependent peptidase